MKSLRARSLRRRQDRTLSAPNPTAVEPSVQIAQAATVKRSLGLRTSLQLSSMVAVQIACNVASQWYVVSLLGAAAQTDALYAGATLPQILISVGVDTL